MTNITHEVWNFLNSEPSIRKELRRGIVNTMALAKHIINKKGLGSSVAAVISSIRRYTKEHKYEIKFHDVESIIKSSRISTKNKITVITMKRDTQIIELLPKIFPLVELSRGDVMRLSEGKESIKLLVDEKNAQKVADIFPSNKILGIKKNLSELNIHFGPGSGETVGVLATIMNELAANEIKIIESIGCLPELMIFVDTKDILKAHETMIRLAE